MYQGDREPGQLNTENVNTGKLMTPAEVYAANVNATVSISTTVTQTNYWGYAATGTALGTGFILTSDGYIATNYHVVKGGTSIKVTLFNDQVFDAHLMAYNEGKDIAILKINASGLPTVVLGDSDKILVGEQIMTIGHPLGELTFSLTVGFVSGMGREVQFSEGKQIDLIQTDCAINIGNSGGAMFNAYGEVVAIVTGKSSGATSGGSYIDNIAYAIPINDIKIMLQQLVEKGYTSRAYLGITFIDVDERMQFYGVPKGASISSVEQASPADKGGLKAYDVITVFNGQKIENKEDLVTAVDACTPNQKVIVSVYRSGEILDLEITLGEKILASEY
jgi:serine protease Do